MAATVRMTAPRVVLVGVGDFGERVADLLAATEAGRRTTAEDDSALERAFADGPDAAVVALWRPFPSLCERVDELAFRYGRPWLPVVMEHPRLHAGPWVDPSHGPCYRCYQARRAQHSVRHETSAALAAAYERDPALGPAGYLPHHARVAAALVRLALRRGLPGPDQDLSVAGEVATVNVLTGQTDTQRTIAVHGCERCSPKDRLGGTLRAVLGART